MLLYVDVAVEGEGAFVCECRWSSGLVLRIEEKVELCGCGSEVWWSGVVEVEKG